MPSPAPLRSFRFGDFEVDFRAGELRKHGRRIRLQEQPLRVLGMLLDRPGELVTREELRLQLWPANTFVDFDHGLNSAVARLREKLNDSAEGPRFVETVPRRGYRFIGQLQELEPEVKHEAATSFIIADFPPRSRLRKLWPLVVSLCVAVVLVAFWVRGFSSKASAPVSPPPEIVPLAGLAGYEVGPSLSPDGNQVAFTEINGRQNSGIYTSLVGGEQSLRLTRDRGDCCVTWSPDGREIAFLRRRDDHYDVYAASALGGAERKLYTTPRILYPSLDWSPDGKSLAFPQSSTANPSSSIILLSLEDSSTRRLTLPPSEYLDRNPSFSPDGRHLAFIRGTLAGVANDVYVVPISGGEARRITFENRPMSGVAWATDCGSELIYSSNHAGAASLWRVPATGGTPTPVAYAGMTAYSPSVARKGKQLAYQQAIGKNNIWRVRVQDGRKLPGRARIAIAAKGLKLRPSFSPDGKRIVFESDRLGAMEIWTCDNNGIKCAQLTTLRSTAGTARWSPDGKWIAFEFHPGEHAQIYLVDAAGGVPRPFVAVPGQDNLAPSWSRDGEWLYFSVKRGSEPFQLWKISIHGGEPVPVTSDGGIAAAESTDGQYLYFSKYETSGIWRIPRTGGPEERVLDKPDGTEWFNWALAGKGIYFLDTTKDSGTTLDFFDLTSGKVNHIWSLDKPWGWGLALSPDAQSLLFVQSEFEESSIMVVKNFR